ncbi:MAG: DUF507 family protein [Myxococcota bacterium]
MRIYSGQVRLISRDVIDDLKSNGQIEIDDTYYDEAIADIEAILREYIRTDREIHEEAREQARARGGGSQMVHRIKRKLAKRRRFSYGEEAQEWIVEQMIEILLYSDHVEEVYADDRQLRRAINKVLKRYLETDDELEKEARSKLKNLEEGSAAWDIEYEKLMGNLKKQKGLL